MKLSEIYRTAVERGIEADARGREEIDRLLDLERTTYEKLEADERDLFDPECLANPYADTRVVVGEHDLEVRGLIVGIDMEAGEVAVADRLRERGEAIDLVLAHHPDGPGYANLHRVMGMQADLWHAQGVGLGAADSLIAPRAEEIRRRMLPVNHYRTTEACRLLGLAYMSCHTPADNCVNTFVQEFLDAEKPGTLDEIVKALRTIPEYLDGAKKGYGPTIVQGSGSARPGRVVVDMTGGTEGPTDALNRLSAAGVDTLVGMHYSEEHRKRAGELNMNLVIAGHISSDALGMNLVLDAIEARGELNVVCTAGMVRFRR